MIEAEGQPPASLAGAGANGGVAGLPPQKGSGETSGSAEGEGFPLPDLT